MLSIGTEIGAAAMLEDSIDTAAHRNQVVNLEGAVIGAHRRAAAAEIRAVGAEIDRSVRKQRINAGAHRNDVEYFHIAGVGRNRRAAARQIESVRAVVGPAVGKKRDHGTSSAGDTEDFRKWSRRGTGSRDGRAIAS